MSFVRSSHPCLPTVGSQVVSSVPGKNMVPVALVPDSVLGESVENGLAVVKVFVEVKNEVFRQR